MTLLIEKLTATELDHNLLNKYSTDLMVSNKLQYFLKIWLIRNNLKPKYFDVKY
jgi:hypothetical protein